MRGEQDARSARLSEEFEDRLRPNRFLGYDRDHLGVALLRREMYEAAEWQFRRAVWLNPYEAGFKQHLAWCLHRMGRDAEALEFIRAAIEQRPEDPDAPVVLERVLEALKDGGAASDGEEA